MTIISGTSFPIKITIAIFICLFLISCSSTAGSKKTFEPAVERDFFTSGVVVKTVKRRTPQGAVLDGFYNFYRKSISPIDNKKCIFYPTCSAYAKEAVRKYGFLRGFPLAMGRLVRCNPTAFTGKLYPKSKFKDIWKAYDPVP